MFTSSLLRLTGGMVATPQGVLKGDVEITRDRITALGEGRRDGLTIPVEDGVVLPGLINAHDHLEFGLFPNLGRGPYPNYVAWGDDIWARERETIDAVLRVPLADRLLWSGYRNLFSGVTTVMHHNPYHPAFERDFPVRVVRDYDWAHSLALEKKPRRIRAGKKPFVIHLAEGTDALARSELRSLHARGALTKNTVIVHGIAIDEDDLDIVPKGCGLVWCPSSNEFLYGRTADVTKLASVFRVALGSDSPLTCKGNFLDEVRIARATVTDEALVAMLTTTPVEMFHLRDRGAIEVGAFADIVVSDALTSDPWQSLFLATPANIQLVLIGGRPAYGDARFRLLFEAFGARCDRVMVEGREKLIAGEFCALERRMRNLVPHCLKAIWLSLLKRE